METYTGKLYHQSTDPESVISNGFDPRYSNEGSRAFFFTDEPQPETNLVIDVSGEGLNLYQGSTYGLKDPRGNELQAKGFDGTRNPVLDHETFVVFGTTEIAILLHALPKLGKPKLYQPEAK